MQPKAATCLIASYFTTLANIFFQFASFPDKFEFLVEPEDSGAILEANLGDVTDPSSAITNNIYLIL